MGVDSLLINFATEIIMNGIFQLEFMNKTIMLEILFII